MIIKSMSRTTGNAASQFGQVLGYLTSPHKLQQASAAKQAKFDSLLQYFAKPDAGQAVLHNLRTAQEDLPNILAEFEKNAAFLPPRKGGVVLYHEVISFHAKDSDRLDAQALDDLARTYLKLRAPNALGFAKSHHDQEHVHIHFVISSNDLNSTKKLSLSRQQFAQIKRDMERYQRQHYPLLVHSEVNHLEPAQKSRSEKEKQRQRRLKKADMSSEKTQAKALLVRAFTEQTSQHQLDSFLLANGFEFYQRGQKTFGVVAKASGRKYRLKTLGLLEPFEQARARWAIVPQRVHDLDQIAAQKQRLEWREMGFSQRMLAVADLLDKAKHKASQHLRLAGKKFGRRFKER